MAQAYNRIPKDLYYLEIAKVVSLRSTCLRKHYGAVIVKNDRIISTGYNGAAANLPNCSDQNYCYRMQNGVPRGTDYTTCKSVHAEQNAIIPVSLIELMGSTLYLYGYDMENSCIVENPGCCTMCKRMIINSHIDTVVFADKDGVCRDAHPTKDFGYKVVSVQRDWIDHYTAEIMGY